MDYIQVIILSILQGMTEFFPISSSAHLIFVPKLAGWEDQGLAFDVAVHIGTLIAVVLYFRKDLFRMIKEFLISLTTRKITPYARLMWCLCFATIPAGIAGLLFKKHIETVLRSPVVIAFTTIGFGILLWLSFRWGRQEKTESSISWKEALVIGCGQALALIPGTSRSGITLTAGLALGLKREDAARFSFLLSVPVIALAGLYETYTLFKDKSPLDIPVLSAGVLLSAISGIICIHVFLKLLQRVGVTPFVIYRILLGMLLFYVFA